MNTKKGSIVLSKKQQKLALSAKKAKKETIKNVLATPFKNHWPLITEQDAVVIQDILRKNLPKFKEEKVNVPWKELKNVPKEQRKEFREKYSNYDLQSLETGKKTDISFGVNEVSKLLETNRAESVLITSDVSPQLLVKHVLDMCVLKQVPVLIAPDLREILKDKTGISSVAVAFKTNTNHTQFAEITEAIKHLSSNYPVPKNHINYERSLEVHDVEDLNKVDNAIDGSIMSLSDIESSDEASEKEASDDRKFYLFRKSNEERVFVPELLSEKVIPPKPDLLPLDSSGFLGFGETNGDAKKYKSLQVKRFKNNKDRRHKKLEMLRTKK